MYFADKYYCSLDSVDGGDRSATEPRVIKR